MDVVYPYKATSEDYELRFSLRSLVNLPHERVFVSGDRPSFISGDVNYISVPPNSDRYQSSTANIFAVAQMDISDDFIVMNDDIFILQPGVLRHEYRCSINEYLQLRPVGGEYRALAESTRDILKARGVADPLFFGLHTPTVYSRLRLIDLIQEFSGQRYLLRTLYHNMFPSPCSRRDDVKVKRWAVDDKSDDLLSISDSCASSMSFRSWIQTRFPERSRYEISGRCLVLGYSSDLWAEVERAIDGPEFDAVIASPEAAAHWPGPVTAIANSDLHADSLVRVLGFDEVVFCGRSEKVAA